MDMLFTGGYSHHAWYGPYPGGSYVARYRHEDPIEPGETYRLGDLVKGAGDGWVQMEAACGSDYSGSSVTASNFRVIKEKFAQNPDVAFYSCYCGGYGVLVRMEPTTQDVRDMIASLNNYPVIDEDDLTNLEIEWADDAWDYCYASDFRRALEKRFDNIEDDIESLDLREFFEFHREFANQYWQSEHASMYIDIDWIADHVASQYECGDDLIAAIRATI